MGKTFSQDQDVNPSLLVVPSFEIKTLAFAERMLTHEPLVICYLVKLPEDQKKKGRAKALSSLAIGRTLGRGT